MVGDESKFAFMVVETWWFPSDVHFLHKTGKEEEGQMFQKAGKGLK